MTKPYCPGTNCPLKETCDRFKTQIDVKKEVHFSEVPYDHKRNKCTYHIKQGETDKLLNRINDIEDGHSN
jgi:hypothetical protein